MWPFHRKIGLEKSGLLQGFTDCHCHLLPGVDDGVKTIREARLILSRYEELGIQNVWLTPHIMEDYPNTTQLLRQRFRYLSATYQGPITLHLAAEYKIDDLFCKRFNDGDLLPWGIYGNRLLVETSYFNPPSNYYDILGCIKATGFSPVVAHPERYLYATLSTDMEMREKGVEFQLDLFSLLGLYGNQVKKNAEMRLQEGLYEYVATDLHSLKELESALQKKLDEKTMEQLHRIIRCQNYWQN